MIIIIVNKMSISEHNSEENNISNSNVNNIEEPKNPQEQLSGIVEPSTEIPSKYILFKDLAAINELNRTETFINNNSHSDIYILIIFYHILKIIKINFWLTMGNLPNQKMSKNVVYLI